MHSRPIRAVDDLYAVFYQSEKAKRDWSVGIEVEKFGVYQDGSAIEFDEVRRVFDALITRYGWQADSEVDGGPVIALHRDRSSLTLEPAAQLELSGAPHRSVHQIAEEYATHLRELHEVSEASGVTWLGVGFHPFATRDDLPWVPKLRYRIMREYLPTRGAMALDMMQRTCTVQANLDYGSEQDAMLKLRCALRIQPIVTAMFANSPFVEGRVTGVRTYRGHVWLDMDPDRCGLLPFAWSDNATYDDYVQWALDVPMFLIKRGGKAISNTEQTFRQFMTDGRDGHRATLDDWDTHLRTLFPEVRLKNTIECRGADSQSGELNLALPALWKGLLYDEASLWALDSLTASLRHEEVEAARHDICLDALSAKLAGRWLRDWAADVLDIAVRGLQSSSLRVVDHKDLDETAYLQPLRALVEQGRCPAENLVAAVGAPVDSDAFRAAVMRAACV
jgi:glutamate--cysteine ligase